MPTSTVVLNRELALAFADVLSYPHGSIDAEVGLCEELARGDSEEAADLLRRFGDYAAAASLGELQEAYTLAFDLDSLSESEPTCYPYVGHHLFEENHKRSAFILGLLERYREQGFASDTGDLPDHLVIVLRFLARCDDDELVAETIDEALLPALARMLGTVGSDEPVNGRQRYQQVLNALALALQAHRPAVVFDEAELAWTRPGDSLGISRDTCGH
jgi:nitrate reductase assembly molybdenum cofactor insertion protein NarJ